MSAVLRLLSSVLTALNWGSLAPALPLPVTVRWCSAPMILTPRKHHSPSDTTWAEVASDLAAQIATASVVSGCLAKQAYSGWPSGLVCTAAMKDTLFGEPRPLVP